MSGNRPWIKLHTQWLDETRLLRLHDRTQLRYFQLYMLAGRLNADGAFIENGHQLDERDIALKLRVRDYRLFQSDIKALKGKGVELIGANGHGLFIKAFKDEQVDWNKKLEADRERQARHRNPVTRDNDVTPQPVTRKSRPQNQIKNQNQIKKEKEIKTTTTTLPSASSRSRRSALVDGGGSRVSKKEKSNAHRFEKLKPEQRKTAEIIEPIMQAAGLRDPKLYNLVMEMATRINSSDARTATLAALASAYADRTAMNKPVVAAHRLINDQVPPDFFNPDKWSALPDNVFKAAGVVKQKGAFDHLLNQEDA